MSDNLDLFRNRIRKVIQDNRQQTEQAKKPFDPGAMLERLLGLNNQPTKLAPGVREKAEEYVTHNINAPASIAYLKGLEYDPERWPADVSRNKLYEKGTLYELNKVGGKEPVNQPFTTERLPAKVPRQSITTALPRKEERLPTKVEPAKKKKQWWEWQGI